MAGNLKINGNSKSLKIGKQDTASQAPIPAPTPMPEPAQSQQVMQSPMSMTSPQPQIPIHQEPVQQQSDPQYTGGLYDSYDSSTIYGGTETISRPAPVMQDIQEDEEPDPKGKKKKQKNKKKKDKKNNNEPLTIEAAYSAYRTRKIILYVAVISSLVLITGFGAYNVFFKHNLTAQEAITQTNSYNNQAKSQQWDSGVQGFLQENLQTMLTSQFKSDGDSQKFSLDNISVERNIPYGEDMFLTFFSADVINGDKVERVFGSMFISVEGNRLSAASTPSISSRKAYSKGFSEEELKKLKEEGTPVVGVNDNKYLKFDPTELNDVASKEFENTLNNFLTLGYNSKQDVSTIYKGTAPLDFNGTFIGIESCQYYDVPNELGFNAVATYTIKLDNLSSFLTTSYYKVSKNSSGSYNIDMIL